VAATTLVLRSMLAGVTLGTPGTLGSTILFADF
jgi:hypothetical protein